MKSFRRILTVVLAVAVLASVAMLASCNDTKAPVEDNADKVYTIGICQLAPHEALDAASEGFMAVLKETLGEDKVVFDYQNAAGDPATCTTIVNNFVSNEVDLIMANATAALQAAANATMDIPVLGTSITEYGVALGLTDFNGTVGGNISGTSDLAPLDVQAQMIIDLFPEAKNVGLLYCSAEANSIYQVQAVKAYLEDKGLTCTEYSFSDSNDIAVVTEKAAADSDVIYIPTDNTAASCTETINNVCLPKKVPVVAGEQSTCAGCGAYTLSISYSELGRKTGAMAAEILTGAADISTMPIQYDPNAVYMYNPVICAELGLTVPENYAALAVAGAEEAPAEEATEAPAEEATEAPAEEATEAPAEEATEAPAEEATEAPAEEATEAAAE